MHNHWLLRRATVAVLALTVSVVPFLSTSAAHGDEIGDLQSRAAQISAQITDLQNQVAADTAAVEQANSDAARIAVQIDAAQAQFDDAKKNEATSRRLLSDFALNAYVTGGTGSVDLAALLDTDAGKIGARQGYQSTTVGNRQELVDQLESAQQITQERAATLRQEHDQAASVAAQAKARRDAADEAQSKLEAIQSQLKGRLAELVAERQAAAARAQQARAEAQARAQAQAAAAQVSHEAPQTPSITAPIDNAPEVGSTDPIVSIPSGSGNGGAAVAAAISQLGVAYVWGGESPGNGFDCSGLTQWAWSQAGVSIPRVTYGQADSGPSIPISQIQPGDLVFYYGFGHVGMYVGGGTIIHAPHTGDVVRYASLYMGGGPIKIVRPG